MALVLADRVRETTTTTGTGTVSLAGPVSGFQGFSAAIGNANTTYYTIVDASTGAWEVGLGTYTSSGSTLARTTILSSSNAGAAVNFAAGTKDVFVTQPAERALYLNGAGTGIDAGVASFTANGVVYASTTSALATGSALTFDGTTLVSGTGIRANSFMEIRSNTSTMYWENAANTLYWAQKLTGSDFAWDYFNGTTVAEKMRLTSTGLGIGNSSPTAKLDVTGTAAISGAVTLSGGTANGVAFLDASKVLTTGSALTFDGSTVRASGVMELGGTDVLYMSGKTGTHAYLSLGASNTAADFFIGSDTNIPLIFRTNATEKMRLTSTSLYTASDVNVGIGTSSPGTRLHVLTADGATTSITAGATGKLRVFGYADATRGALLDSINTAENTYLPLTINGSSLLLQTGATTRATLDSAGNLGLGVTPSAWYTTIRALQIGSVGGAFIAGNTSAGGGSTIGLNTYFDAAAATARYGASSFASRYTQLNGAHEWYTAPSGTAGNAISFTQAMTLDASGNLGVGDTSPLSTLSRVSARGPYADLASGYGTILAGSTDSQAADKGGTLAFTGVFTGTTPTIFAGIKGAKENSTDGNFSGYLSFWTRTNGSVPAERARITSGGDLLVGATTNTSSSKLILGGATNWGVGTQSGGNIFYIVRDSDGVGQYMVQGSTSWTSTSDERVKDIIEPITDAANKVSTLRAVIGKFKKDAEGTRRSFLIAQDVQAVLPEAVTIQEDEFGTLGVQYTEVIPLLVAAIKEQQTLITDLTARITALESSTLQ